MADAELVQESAEPDEPAGPDEIDQALEEMLTKYKKSTDQKSRFMMVDDVVPMFQAMRQEYMDGFAAQQAELEDLAEAVDSAEYVENLERVVTQGVEVGTASAVFIDTLLKELGMVDEKNEQTDKFPEKFKPAYAALRTQIGALLASAGELKEAPADDDDAE